MPDQLPLIPDGQPVPLDELDQGLCDHCGGLTEDIDRFCEACDDQLNDPEPILDLRPIVTVDTKGKL